MPQANAIGFLETRGMTALIGGADAMLKAAEVRLAGRHGIGSGWVTVVVEGEVAAVQAALRVGREEARQHGELIGAEVVARPEERAMGLMPHRSLAGRETGGRGQALGILETRGLTPLIEGADAMLKTASVELDGWAFIGGALAHLVAWGSVGAVQTAVAAGREAAAAAGDVHASLVIPHPAPGLGALLPPAVSGEPSSAGALGVLETIGYATVVSGTDAMVKAADVELVRLSIVSGGRIAALVKGSLDAVQAAMAAGAAQAGQTGQVDGARVISRPAPGVMACFGGTFAGQRTPGPRQRALGLIETRSTVALVKAVDQMLKAAAVEYEGSYKVGYFLTASAIRGDVGAVRAALDAGAVEAARYGELVAVHLIPNPYAGLEERLPHQ